MVIVDNNCQKRQPQLKIRPREMHDLEQRRVGQRQISDAQSGSVLADWRENIP
jgi:hypothetical protein